MLSSYDPSDFSQQQNVCTPHQLSSGPIRTELSSTNRLKPYETRHVRTAEREIAAVEPSTFAYPPVIHVGLPIPGPSGGLLSETSADAEQTETITEQDEVPVSNFYRSHTPHATECLFSVGSPGSQGFQMVRESTEGTVPRQTTWHLNSSSGLESGGRFRVSMRHWPVSLRSIRHNNAPDSIGRHTEALEAISAIRPVTAERPYLRKPAMREVAAPSKNARKERNRRMEERRLYEGLSMRYPPGRRPWERSTLLAHGKCNHTRCVGDTPLTRIPLSGTGFGDAPRPPKRSWGFNSPNPATFNRRFDIRTFLTHPIYFCIL